MRSFRGGIFIDVKNKYLYLASHKSGVNPELDTMNCSSRLTLYI